MNRKQKKHRRTKKVYYSDSENSIEDIEMNSDDGAKGSSKKKSRQRQENSLGELTKNFISFIKDQDQREIDINDVVKQLKVKKRRIYDITNVLEGKSIDITKFLAPIFFFILT